MASPSKKRKRDEGQVKYKLVYSSKESHEVGPVIASFTSVTPPDDTPFQCYFGNEKSSEAEVDFPQQNMLIAGESSHIDFVTRQKPSDRTDGGSRYVIGIRNKATKTIAIRECPLHIVSREVKRLKGLDTIRSTSDTRMMQRAKLGEAFGTKKAQKLIRARERNQVDVSSMQGILEHIGEGVQGRMEGLGTAEQAEDKVNKSRPIPPFDNTATSLEGCYPVSLMLPQPELSSIRTGPFVAAAARGARTDALPFKRSTFINTRLQDMDFSSAPTGKDKKRIQLMYYLAALFQFQNLKFLLSDKATTSERMHSVPQPIIDGMFSRFTESERESTKTRLTSDKELLLLSTILVLTLHIDNFVVDSAQIANDLSMSVAKINQIYKSLGCKVEVPTAADTARIGAKLGGEKKAILRLPLTFPKPRIGKRRA